MFADWHSIWMFEWCTKTRGVYMAHSHSYLMHWVRWLVIGHPGFFTQQQQTNINLQIWSITCVFYILKVVQPEHIEFAESFSSIPAVPAESRLTGTASCLPHQAGHTPDAKNDIHSVKANGNKGVFLEFFFFFSATLCCYVLYHICRYTRIRGKNHQRHALTMCQSNGRIWRM